MESETGKRKRTRLVRVDQAMIDFMLRHEQRRPPVQWRDFPESIDRLVPGFRASQARIGAVVKRDANRDADILRQFRAKGFAEVELDAEQLSDDEADEEEAHAIAGEVGQTVMPPKKK